MPDVYKTVVTKANLQYYHGKLKRQIDDLGTVKKFRVGAVESETNPNDKNAELLDTNHDWMMNISHGDRNGVTNYTLGNEDGTCQFGDYYNSTDTYKNGCVRINAVADIGMSQLGDVLVYKKPELDSMFQALNGLKFQKVDTNKHSTLGDFTSITRYDTTPNVPGEDEQMNPWFWDNKIALYPYDGELLEYVLTWSKSPEDITADNEWVGDTWKNYASWEFVGSTKQDLTGYLQDGQIEAVDNDYIDGLFLKDLKGGVYTSTLERLTHYDGPNMFVSTDEVNALFVLNPYADVIMKANVNNIIGNNVNVIVFSEPYSVANDPGGMGGTGFQGITSIETIMFTKQVMFNGDCFSNCADLKRIYIPEGSTITSENLGNCTAKVIYI